MEQNQGISPQYPPTIIHQGDKADLLEKIRPDDVVLEIKQRLLGREKNESGTWIDVPEMKERALTMKGAFELSTLMLPVSSRNVSISKLKDDEIRKRTINICRQAQRMCLDNWDEYGITRSDQLGFVHQIIFSNTFITLKQPEGEGIRKMLMGTMSEQRTLLGEAEPQRRGLKGLFKLK